MTKSQEIRQQLARIKEVRKQLEEVYRRKQELEEADRELSNELYGLIAATPIPHGSAWRPRDGRGDYRFLWDSEIVTIANGFVQFEPIPLLCQLQEEASDE